MGNVPITLYAVFQTSLISFKNNTLHHFKNVDETSSPVTGQINELHSQGLYDQAPHIIQNNSDILA